MKKKIQDISRALECINISAMLASHLFGENHKNWHRRGFGILIAGIGVFVIHSCTGQFFLIEYFGDLVGAYLHGIAILPWIENIENHKNFKHVTDQSNS